MPLQAGRELGHYQILEPIGKGGMGEVYRARDRKLGRDVAIKVLPEDLAGDPARLSRFQREARLLAALNHPNIASIHGLEESEGTHYLVLELVEGQTLGDRLSRRPIPVDHAVAIAGKIALALKEAHGRGIVHRDLKPANVKLTADGNVKVLDFGLAKSLAGETAGADGSESPTLGNDATREGVVLGTAAYMSPEQARGQDVDARSDIWSFGCVLWECLTGKKAFGGATPSDSIGAILHAEPDWGCLPPDTPTAVRRLLRRCLAKNPDARLHHIADARIELEDGDPPPLAGRGASRGYKIAVVLLAVGLVTALTAALLSFTRPAADSSSSQDNPLAGARFTRVTDFEGSEFDAAISPDGRFVTFVSDRDGRPSVFVGQIDTGEFRNLTRLAEWGGPQDTVRTTGFSGDGSEVWWSDTSEEWRARVRTTPLLGGPVRAFLEEGVINVAWSPDGERVVYHTNQPGDPVHVADRNGADSRLILPSPEGSHQHFPTWSVDGRWIYLTRGRQTTLEMDLWRVRPDGPDGRGLERLTRGKLDVKYPTPLDDRTVLYSARDRDGAGPWLWALDVETKVSRRASVGLEQYGSVAASRDRRRLVATVQDRRAELWSVPILDRLAIESDAEPYAGLPTERALAPRFGGAALFFLSSRGSGDGLWRFEDGQVTEIWRGSETALLEPAAVSPDGDSVVVLLRGAEGWHLNVLSADGAQLEVLSEAVDARGAAAWSPDGQWVVTEGSDEAGVMGLYKIPVSGDAPVRIADGEAMDPVWSPDGQLIVYAGPQVAAFCPLLAVRPDGTPVALPEIQVWQFGERARFLPDGSGLVYLKGERQSADLWLLDLATMTSRQLTRFAPGATMRTFDVTPDGRRIVFDRLGDDSDIVLIERGQAAPELQRTLRSE